MGFSVLVVCTANLCRSPMTEHLLRREVDRAGLDWTVSSCGTHADPGHDMDPRSRTVLGELDITPQGFQTRRLTPELIAAADLVVTAETRHRGIVATMQPRALRRTYPLLQMAELAEHITAPTAGQAAGPWLLEQLPGARGLVQSRSRSALDLPDPVRGDVGDFRRCAQTIVGALSATLQALEPAPDRRPAWS